MSRRHFRSVVLSFLFALSGPLCESAPEPFAETPDDSDDIVFSGAGFRLRLGRDAAWREIRDLAHDENRVAGGFDMIYFDGGEDVPGDYWYHSTKFQPPCSTG